MRFLVDGMLGGLARWLRILGQDVRYDSKATDSDLLRVAKEQSMILLTSDRELYERAIAREISSALVLGDTEEERLAQIANSFDISLEVTMAKTKCPECGSDLTETSKEEVASKVPPASLKQYDQFWKCRGRNCGKVYWVGSHWKQIHQTLEGAKKRASLEH
jgi:uncharacterized protein